MSEHRNPSIQIRAAVESKGFRRGKWALWRLRLASWWWQSRGLRVVLWELLALLILAAVGSLLAVWWVS